MNWKRLCNRGVGCSIRRKDVAEEQLRSSSTGTTANENRRRRGPVTLKSELHSRTRERTVGALDDGSEVVEQMRAVAKVRMIDVGSWERPVVRA